MKPELSTTGEKWGESKVFKEFVSDKNRFEYARNPDLLDRAAKLNKLSEVSQVALGMCLAEIKRTEAYRPEYEDFKDYYSKELGRTKGDVSKLLTVGRFMLDNGFPEDTDVGYTKLYISQSVFEGKDPKYILAEAQTNTVAAMLENSRDVSHPNCAHKNTHACTACDDCGKHTRNQE